MYVIEGSLWKSIYGQARNGDVVVFPCYQCLKQQLQESGHSSKP